MKVPYEFTQSRDYLFRETVSYTKKQPNVYHNKMDDQVPRIVACEPFEKVLKVASISAMLNKKQDNKVSKLKTFSSLPKNGNNEKFDQIATKKSINILYNKENIDLSNAPIFQILCEISKM